MANLLWLLGAVLVLGTHSLDQSIIEYMIMEAKPGVNLIGNPADNIKLRATVGADRFSSLEYAFVRPSDPHMIYFKLQKNGAIYTTGPIDREEICHTDFCAVNLDVAAHLKSTGDLYVLQVRLTITDINDNPPRFSEGVVQLRIPETASVDEMFQISGATDRDAGPVNTVTEYRLDTIQSVFQMKVIENLDGTTDLGIVVKQPLDRENRENYRLTITALDGGSPRQSGSCVVNIKITDTNDHYPIFSQKLYNVTVKETVPIGTVITRVHATDRDAGLNAHIRYQLSSRTVETHPRKFQVNETSGEIKVMGILDYEASTTRHFYQLTVEATDRGGQPKTSQATILVYVQDINDTPPKILFNLLAGGDHATVSEWKNKGALIAHVSVTDPDMNGHQVISCHLNDPRFLLRKLANRQYKIELNTLLDREITSRYSIRVTCQDDGSPMKQSTELLVVRVLDENDNPPTFRKQSYDATIPENYRLQKSILKVSAFDRDMGENGHVQYFLDESMHQILSVGSQNGILVAKDLLDREITPVLRFTIMALDNGMPRLTARVPVVLTLRDLNDESPTFSDTEYTFNLLENELPDTAVGNVTATDRDLGVGGEVSYSIIPASDPMRTFYITPTGEILTNHICDREKIPVYQITVMAMDNGLPVQSSLVTVNINILDENDNSPEIKYPNSFNDTVGIPHTRDVGSWIATIKATDKDSGENAKLNFHIEQGNLLDLFRLDVNSGNLTLGKSLHLHDANMYKLVIAVSDKASTTHTDLNVVIYIDNTTVGSINGGEDSGKNRDIIIALVCATILMVIIVAVVIICIRRRDMNKHNYRAKSEEQKIIRRRGSESSASKNSNQSDSTEHLHLPDPHAQNISAHNVAVKDVSLSDEAQMPLTDHSTLTQVSNSFSILKDGQTSYVSSIDHKTLEFPQACSSLINNNTTCLSDSKTELMSNSKGSSDPKLTALSAKQQPPCTKTYLQIIEEDTERSKTLLKRMDDTVSDDSQETTVTMDSGRGASDDDLNLKEHNQTHYPTAKHKSPPETRYGYNNLQGGNDYCEMVGSHGVHFSHTPIAHSHNIYMDMGQQQHSTKQNTRRCEKPTPCNSKGRKLHDSTIERNIDYSIESITDNTRDTVVRTVDYKNRTKQFIPDTPKDHVLCIPSHVQSNMVSDSGQDSVPLRNGFLSRLDMKSPSAHMCSPSLRADNFPTVYNITAHSEHVGYNGYSLADIESATDTKDDDASTTTSGSYTINPEDLCNEIDELFFRDIIV